MSDNPASAENQQGSLRRASTHDPSETTRRAPLRELEAYLQGALHDGTYNRRHRTFRISQKEKSWLKRLQSMFNRLGSKAWIYKEGKHRNVYVLETTAAFLNMKFDPRTLKTTGERMAYVRGYFDAEGGIPHSSNDRLYIQMCQKNKSEITKVRSMLEQSDIRCGVVHNPSKAVDPHYWRFFVSMNSHKNFIQKVSSWHPRKQKLLNKRTMI